MALHLATHRGVSTDRRKSLTTTLFAVDIIWVLAQFVFPHVDVLGLPIRLCVGGLMAALIVVTAFENCLVLARISRTFLWMWAVYCTLGLVSATFNGDLTTSRLGPTVSKYLSQFGVATLAFLYFATIRRDGRHLTALLWVMLALGSTSAILAWLQASGRSWAWQIASLVCGPPTMMDSPVASVAPVGLGVFSVTSATYTLCLGVAATGLVFQSQDACTQPRTPVARVTALLACGICLSAGIPFLSRSSLLIAAACIAALILGYIRHIAVSVFLCVALALGGLLIASDLLDSLNIERISESRIIDSANTTSRLRSLDNDERTEAWGGALESIAARPLFGGKIAAAKGEMADTTSPHNLILGSAVYYGVPTACALALFVAAQVWACWKVFRSRGRSNSLGLQFGVAVALMAYNCKGLFHNDNFSHGGILGMMLLGLLLTPTWTTQGELRLRPRSPRAHPAPANAIAVTSRPCEDLASKQIT